MKSNLWRTGQFPKLWALMKVELKSLLGLLWCLFLTLTLLPISVLSVIDCFGANKGPESPNFAVPKARSTLYPIQWLVKSSLWGTGQFSQTWAYFRDLLLHEYFCWSQFCRYLTVLGQIKAQNGPILKIKWFLVPDMDCILPRSLWNPVFGPIQSRDLA